MTADLVNWLATEMSKGFLAEAKSIPRRLKRKGKAQKAKTKPTTFLEMLMGILIYCIQPIWVF